ncbi:MAG: DUF1634 domain-containing protein [Elusimicrobia bacterium]|nr:DUF1634 domain-containing protein [Elusimicrobiota bacterium]
MADDRELRGRLAAVLRGGAAAGSLLLAAGLGASLLGRLEAGTLLALGLWSMVATPAARVAVAGWGWWRAGERRYASVCAAVLVLLAAAVRLGKAH